MTEPCIPVIEAVEIGPFPEFDRPAETIHTLHCPHLTACGDPDVLADVASDHTRRSIEARDGATA